MPTIGQALIALRKLHTLPHVSTEGLRGRVALAALDAKKPHISRLVAAPRAFNRARQRIVPAAALANLSRSIPLSGLQDPYRLFERWASLKYVGALRGDGGGTWQRLGLTEQTERVRANQRRVFSEELGVAFAIAAGERWHAIAHGGSVNVVSIDIDNLVDVPGYRSWGIAHLAGKRTDFLQLSPTGNGMWWRVSALEAKGTRQSNESYHQLAKADQQLGQLSIHNVTPPGLAVGSVLAIDKMYVNVLTRRVIGTSASKAARVDRRSHGASALLIDLQTDIAMTDQIDPFSDIARAAIRTSWAQLGAVAGSPSVTSRWTSQPTDNSSVDQSRELETAFGPVRGMTATLNALNGRIEMQVGVAAEVFDALEHGDGDEVARTQIRVAANRTGDDEMFSGWSARTDDNQLALIGRDGMVVSFREIRD